MEPGDRFPSPGSRGKMAAEMAPARSSRGPYSDAGRSSLWKRLAGYSSHNLQKLFIVLPTFSPAGVVSYKHSKTPAQITASFAVGQTKSSTAMCLYRSSSHISSSLFETAKASRILPGRLCRCSGEGGAGQRTWMAPRISPMGPERTRSARASMAVGLLLMRTSLLPS